ncbi:RagB/SusD family nutrient uptake outer membrane protein [Siphonobacter sp. BAB-5405]|uniref:RagB/SusD family nutrient uptake outer membrane protein n=1 Tax=Siphonobacter sp. BAB-5405 TaxID=1864825 RepID=UPI0013050399
MMWDGAYKLIYASNQVIQAIPDNAPAADLQLKGENLYLRALMHFSLVRIFGLPYAQNPAQNLGVPS